MQPAQIYETAIFDRESGSGLTYVTIPLHALPWKDPDVAFTEITAELRFQGELIPGEQGEQRLTEALDVMLTYPFEFRTQLKIPPSGPSEFAGYLASEAKIPVEQSPVGGKTLTDILASGGVAYGIAQGKPLSILMGLGTIILIGPAEVVGEWGTTKLRKLLNVPGRD